MPQQRIEQILLKAKLVDEMQLGSARQHLSTWGGFIGRAVVEKGFATEPQVVEAIARELGLTQVALNVARKNTAALAKVPLDFAESKNLFPVSLGDGGKTLVVAMSDPTDLDATDSLVRLVKCRVKVQVAGFGEIADAIRVHYKGEAPQVSGVSKEGGARPGALDLGPMLDDSSFDVAQDRSFDVAQDRSFDVAQDRSFDVATAKAGGTGLMQGRVDEPPPIDATAAFDELLGVAPPSPGWTPDDLARLDMLRANQEKGARVLQALIDLCIKKGVIDLGEYRARTRR